jgi:glycosyltransferase involved in cell wall biosynthesis
VPDFNSIKINLALQQQLMKKLSIIIPVYNEQDTIFEVLEKVNAVQLLDGIEKEIVVVDDVSKDNSLHDKNYGKGAGIRSCLHSCTGEYIIIQDADLELDPSEYNNLLAPVLAGESTIVYGSRFLNNKQQHSSKMSQLANNFLTWLSNVTFRTRLTDMETCYKLVPTTYFQAMILKEDRFGFEPEITAKLAKIPSATFKEVPITYLPRSSDAGKKIGWKDGFRAIYCILKYGWFNSAKKSFTKPVSEL